MSFFSRANPLFFRKDGALDFGPAVWAMTAIIALVMLVLDAFGIAAVSVAAWAFLGSFTAIASIAGAAAERAYWISQSKTPGEIARGIAEAGSERPVYRMFTDPDEIE